MNENSNPKSRPMAAFVLCLIAGLWLVAAGGMMEWGHMGGWGGHMSGPGGGPQGGGQYDWMWRHHRMMHGYGGGGLWNWLGVLAGVVVLAGAVFLYARPQTARGWGVAVIIASAVALMSGLGGLLGGVLGIVGGSLAILSGPRPQGQ